MWVSIFLGVTKVIGFLSGVAGWLHDREQRRAGEVDVVVKAQNKAIQTMKETLAVNRVQTRDELRKKLNNGEL